jgi:hypothetical protein
MSVFWSSVVSQTFTVCAGQVVKMTKNKKNTQRYTTSTSVSYLGMATLAKSLIGPW